MARVWITYKIQGTETYLPKDIGPLGTYIVTNIINRISRFLSFPLHLFIAKIIVLGLLLGRLRVPGAWISHRNRLPLDDRESLATFV